MIYSSIKNRNINVDKVNSNRKEKNNNQYFNAFVSEAITRLNQGRTIICFNKEQVEEIQKSINITATYNKSNNWWVVSKKRKEKKD